MLRPFSRPFGIRELDLQSKLSKKVHVNTKDRCSKDFQRGIPDEDDGCNGSHSIDRRIGYRRSISAYSEPGENDADVRVA